MRNAHVAVYTTAARSIAPRKAITVSEWADKNIILSSKNNAAPGKWRTSRNPPVREPLDCMSARSKVREMALMWPIQFAKTAVNVITVGYTMDENPGPIMVCLPGEVSLDKYIDEKLQPTIDETAAMKKALATSATRNSSNTRTFKDFSGGQLYLEHAGSPARLKSSTVRDLIVDELDEIPHATRKGDDPMLMLDGRTSGFPTTSKKLMISSPQVAGVSRIEALWLDSDKRRYYVPCPDCGHEQPLEWAGLHWTPDGSQCWYACRCCDFKIDEGHKTQMIARGRWVAENPSNTKRRGYHLNCLYYAIGLGPRWLQLVAMFRDAVKDPAKLKTFTNDRLAEPWEDPAMRKVKHDLIRQRAESYSLRSAPAGVLAVTVGVDTQDEWLAVQFIGWGRRECAWTLDYVELPGDPAEDAVWCALVELVNRKIEHAYGSTLRVEAVGIDMRGHRTEAVKNFVRSKRVPRPMALYGAKANNAQLLGKARLTDVTWNDKTDKKGVHTYQVGTVNAKHWLYGRIGADTDKEVEARFVHLSEELPDSYFEGLVSEVYNPTKNRFEKKTSARNEPLDTWIYAYAAAHHPELRLHRRTEADWSAIEAHLIKHGTKTPIDAAIASTPTEATPERARKRKAKRSTWGDEN